MPPAGRHVDHVHSDAIIAIAAWVNSRDLTREIFGDEFGWLAWKKPCYKLGLWLEKLATGNPGMRGAVVDSQGLFTWADDARDCYLTTLEIVNKAAAGQEAKSAGKPAFGGARVPTLPADEPRAVAARLTPVIRGLISGDRHKVGHFDDQPAVLEFVGSQDLASLTPLGTSCPDHLMRTKIRPLVVDVDPAAPDLDATIASLPGGAEPYRQDYAAYCDRCKKPDLPALRDPNAVVWLVPRAGMITFALDKATARISGEFYVNAINVMRGASAVSTYPRLPEHEVFDIEYWLLKEAKLQRMPRPRALAGRVALLTGGIGSATAERLLQDGAYVVLADIDGQTATDVAAGLAGVFGADAVHSTAMNVTCADEVIAAYRHVAVELGGVDILVSNGGIASAAPVEETSLALWNRNMDILSTGYPWSAARHSRPCAAWAKAAELHLARCLALEGAEGGIRVNVVNPDAVLRGSKIWSGEWLDQRASTYRTDKEGLEEMYRNCSMLKRLGLPEDIAEGVYFFASDLSAKSTGTFLDVDAGNVQAFTR